MADQVKISELPVTTSVSTGDYIPVVEDGITKRVQAGPSGGLDADTVSGYGIGTETAPFVTDLNAITKTGCYSVADNNAQAPAVVGGTLFHIAGGALPMAYRFMCNRTPRHLGYA